jgi:hypothetical protein
MDDHLSCDAGRIDDLPYFYCRHAALAAAPTFANQNSPQRSRAHRVVALQSELIVFLDHSAWQAGLRRSGRSGGQPQHCASTFLNSCNRGGLLNR